MVKIFAGNRRDKTILQEVIEEHKSKKIVKDQPIKTIHKNQSSQIFIIQPEEDIPARSGDTVTSKPCKIYQLKDFDYETGQATLTEQATVKRNVYNLGESAVSSTDYEFCVRTNYKDLFVQPGGGTGEVNETTYIGRKGERDTPDEVELDDGKKLIRNNILADFDVGFNNTVNRSRMIFTKAGHYLITFLLQVGMASPVPINTYAINYRGEINKLRLADGEYITLQELWSARQTIHDNTTKFNFEQGNFDRGLTYDRAITGSIVVEIEEVSDTVSFFFEILNVVHRDLEGVRMEFRRTSVTALSRS